MFVVPVEIQSSFLNARRAFALRALTK